MKVRVVSAPCTGRRWLERELTGAFGCEVKLWSTGTGQLVATPPFIKAGEKTVVPIFNDVYHVIEAADQDEDHTLHALPIVEQWSHHYDNVHGVNLFAEDKDAEAKALAEFLEVEPLRPVDWSHENQGPDKFGLREEYETTGRIPGEIQVLLNRVPVVKVPEGVEGHEEQRDGGVIIVSVPHTASTFTRKLIVEQLGLKGVVSYHVPSHKEASEKEIKRLMEKGVKLVVCLRDPVRQHWSTRNRDQEPAEWWSGWSTLAEYADYEHAHFFVSDCNEDQRLPRLRALCEFLEVPPATSVDWSAVNTRFDKTGAAGLYLRGMPNAETLEVIKDLQANGPLCALLKRERCSYPWLDEV